MSAAKPLPSSLFYQAFRSGQDFGYTHKTDGTTVSEVIEEYDLWLEPLGDIPLSFERSQPELRLSPTGPSSIVLMVVTDEFDINWEPVSLTIISQGTDKKVKICPDAVNRTHMFQVGQDCIWYTGKALRYNHVKVPEMDELYRGYHDIVYIVQFDRKIGTTFMPDASSTSPPVSSYSLTCGNDVALIFPLESLASPAVPWTSKTSLVGISSYFEAIFAGGYTEAGNILPDSSKVVQASEAEIVKLLKSGQFKSQSDDTDEDSDFEDSAANAVVGRGQEAAEDYDMVLDGKRQPAQGGTPSAIQYIIIKHASYKTYKALLEWARTGYIQFSWLRSSSSVYSPNPCPSPKSVYKLAHYLDIRELEDVAAKNFEWQLDPSNVLKELFSQTCFTHPVLREAGYRAFEYWWKEVEESGGLGTIAETDG